ncbi:MAG: hypothetical protein QOH15_2294 [Gaiellales bacterium]|nr:hypothetical protein [Gaiellales bacterium]
MGDVEFFTARVLMTPVLESLIRLAGRVTDPLLEPLEHAQLVRSTLGSARVRSTAIAVVGALLRLEPAGRRRL